MNTTRRAFLGASTTLLALGLSGPERAAAQPSATASSQRMSDAEIVAALRARLEQLAAADMFSGAVLLAKNGQVLFEKAYGYADHAFNVPNRVDTKFNLGSMGKMFTGVAVLQLEQQGKLSLEDRLIKLVPDYPDKDIAAKITIYQLLTHTSGLGDMFGPKFFDTPKDRFDTIESHLPLFTGKPLLFEPGTKWSYSNAGFIVLGWVIEKVSGESYYDYVRRHVFKPAGMTDTDNYEPDQDVPNLALGYVDVRPEPKPGEPRRAVLNFPGALPVPGPRKTNVSFVARGASAGGGYSTVGDLLRFAQALEGHVLLDKAHTDLDMTGHVATPHGNTKYAFGMEEQFLNGVRIVGHSGGEPGINSNLDMYAETGYVTVVMSNYDNGVMAINTRLRGWLTGEKSPQAVRVSAAVLRDFAGTYQVAPPPRGAPSGAPAGQTGMSGESPLLPALLQITSDATGLWLTSGGRHRLLPLSATEFFDDNAPDLRFTFTKDAGGRVAAFTFAGPGGMTLTATRTG